MQSVRALSPIAAADEIESDDADIQRRYREIQEKIGEVS